MAFINTSLTSESVKRLLHSLHFEDPANPKSIQGTVVTNSPTGHDSVKVALEGVFGIVVLLKVTENNGFHKDDKITITVGNIIHLHDVL